MSTTIHNMYLLRKPNKLVVKHMLDSLMKSFVLADMWRLDIADLFTLKTKRFLFPISDFGAKNLKCFLNCNKYVYG